MERAIAEMEKIKRAEEIYSRRKNLEDDKKSSSKNIYKILFEILFLFNVVIIIVAYQNQKYIFTDDFIKKVNSYNINIKNKAEELFSSPKKEKKEENVKKDNITNETAVVSGESNDVTSALVENEIKPLTQEELDIKEIKEKYSVIWPLKGIKTSSFGQRESTNSKVTKYHTGIDIAEKKGSPIISAINGTVIKVSENGDYGKHIKIQTENLVSLYAHCSKIDVKEGQVVNQGEKIGEVGSTGNSTGPHLHFELKLYDRLVNPEKVLGELSITFD